jgi:putative heme iron utilization protein
MTSFFFALFTPEKKTPNKKLKKRIYDSIIPDFNHKHLLAMFFEHNRRINKNIVVKTDHPAIKQHYIINIDTPPHK